MFVCVSLRDLTLIPPTARVARVRHLSSLREAVTTDPLSTLLLLIFLRS